jgi:glycosyltransferase involved in cell wall biosynthesis
VLPEEGPLAGRLRDAGTEVLVQRLAVLRRAGATPTGLMSLSREARRDAAALAPLARERSVALVHANTSVMVSSGAVAAAAGAAHLIHVREIYTGAGGRVARMMWPLMKSRLLHACALACISEAVAAQFEGSPRARVLRDGLPRVPRPPERTAARAELGLDPEAFVVALVGRVSDWKGQDVLARALATPALADVGAVGVVAGDDVPGSGAAAKLDALAEELGVSDRLMRLGYREDIDTVLGAADALAVPSTRPEPLGLVALEGAAAGLPVVASAAGGVTEAVIGGETGTLVAPGDPAALAAALRTLADDPALGRAMGEAGSRLVAERFSEQRMLEGLQELYDELAG